MCLKRLDTTKMHLETRGFLLVPGMLLNTLPPTRRSMYALRDIIKQTWCRCAFHAWASLLHRGFEPGETIGSGSITGWMALTHAQECISSRKKANTLESSLLHIVNLLQTCIQPFLSADRSMFLWRQSYTAQRASDNGDSRQCYAIVRSLAGKRNTASHQLRFKNGQLSTSKEERNLCWQEHNTIVFSGNSP